MEVRKRKNCEKGGKIGHNEHNVDGFSQFFVRDSSHDVQAAQTKSGKVALSEASDGAERKRIAK